MKRIALILALALSGMAHAGTLGHGFRLAALPKVERSGASVIHLSWETKL